MKKRVMRLTAFLLLLAMTLAMVSGCGQSEQSKKVVFKAGDTEVTLDELWFYCKSVQEYYESYYSSMFSSPDVWTSAYPVTKGDGSTEESTLENIAKRSAIKQIRQIKIAVAHAKDVKVSLSETEKEAVTSQAASFMEKVTKDEIMKMGLSKELAEQVFSESALVEKMKTKLAEDEGIEISDEEAQTSKIYYIQFPTAAATASGDVVVADEDNLKQAKEDAQKALERVLAGNDIATVAAAYGMGSTSGQLSIDAESDLPVEISDSIANLKDGETYDKLIKTSDGFYIIQMVQVIDEEATSDKKEELLSKKEQELLDKKFDEWSEEDDFDYDKDVNWDYMKEIDFVANSSVTASDSSNNGASQDASKEQSESEASTQAVDQTEAGSDKKEADDQTGTEEDKAKEGQTEDGDDEQ